VHIQDHEAITYQLNTACTIDVKKLFTLIIFNKHTFDVLDVLNFFVKTMKNSSYKYI